MPFQIAPGTNCFFIAPERERQIFAFCHQAFKAFDRYEPVDSFQIAFQRRREIEVLAGASLGGPDFKDHCNHRDPPIERCAAAKSAIPDRCSSTASLCPRSAM